MARFEVKGGSPEDEVSRRNFLRRGSIGFATALAAMTWTAPATGALRRKKRAVYKLDPEWGTGPTCQPNPHKVSSCHACRACHRHARNKLFATEKAAMNRRAHPHCNCKVIVRYLPKDTWIKLFGRPMDLKRKSVDKRWPWVRDTLNKA